MPVKVVNVSERSQLGANGTITQVLVLKYMVGSTGPFTLITNAAELANGTALTKMNAFAATVGSLPIQNNA